MLITESPIIEPRQFKRVFTEWGASGSRDLYHLDTELQSATFDSDTGEATITHLSTGEKRYAFID